MIEYFDELVSFLDTQEALSEKKLRLAINSYYDKRQKYGSDSFRDMYFKKEDILELNPLEDWARAQAIRIEKYKKDRYD